MGCLKHYIERVLPLGIVSFAFISSTLQATANFLIYLLSGILDTQVELFQLLLLRVS